MQRRAALFLLASAVSLAAACAPAGKPSRDDADAGPDVVARVGPLDFEHEGWLQDRYAIMARWYDYDSDVHALTPRPYAWILEDGDRYAALRVVSYYDAETADPGRITLSLSTWDGAAWTAEAPWTASKNIKDEDVPVCLDVFARAEVDCAGDAWQLMLRMYKDMATSSAIVIKDPGLFVRSWSGRPDLGAVRVARVDDAADLSSLPAPTSLQPLDEAPAATTTEWDFSKLAPNLPENGMALGESPFGEGFSARDEAYFVATSKFLVVKTTIAPAVEGDASAGVRFRWGASKLDREDFSVEEAPPIQETVVPSPAVGEVAYVSFEGEGLAPDPADLEGTSWPFLPPENGGWDLALERTADDAIRVLVSPAASVFVVRPHLCDPAGPMPPLEELVPPHFVDAETAENPCPEE